MLHSFLKQLLYRIAVSAKKNMYRTRKMAVFAKTYMVKNFLNGKWQCFNSMQRFQFIFSSPSTIITDVQSMFDVLYKQLYETKYSRVD